MAEINASSGKSIGYGDFIGTEGSGGMGDAIKNAYEALDKARKAAQDAGNAGDPVTLLEMQMAMNTLSQIMSMSTQMINSMKTMCESTLRNIG